MKKFISLVLALVMALSLTTVAWGAATEVGTYADFKTAVQAGGEVKLTANIEGDGIVIDNSVTIDLNGFSYTINGKTVGSNHTETLGMQINESAGTVVIKNGSIIGSDAATKPASTCGVTGCTAAGHTDVPIPNNGVKMVIQNYADLTLDGVTVTGNSKAGYVVSNNSGDVVLEDTTITAAAGNVAFDTCKYSTYAAPTVTVKGASVINGTVEAAGGKLEVEGGTVNGEIAVVPGGDAADITVSGGTFASALPAGTTVAGNTATDVNGNLIVVSGAITPASAAKGAYYTTDMANLSVYPTCDMATYKYTLEKYTTAADNAKAFAQVAIWQTHKITGAKTIAYTAVVASADSANLAFVNGREITYLNTNVTTWTAKATAVKTVDIEDVEKCGDVFTADDVAVYEDVMGNLFVEDIAGDAYNVNGKLVMLETADEAYPVVDSAALEAALASPAAGTVYTVKHDYDADVKTVNSDTTITRVFCTECKKNFSFLEGTQAQAIAKFGAGNFALETIDGMPVYVALTGSSVGGTVVTPDTDKVTSAETFDAGIAMYVGMSVMAAAGSAVVLKKRED